MLKHPDKPGVMDPANQLGFFKIIALPLVLAWSEVFKTAGATLVRQAQDNMQHWKLLRDAGKPLVPEVKAAKRRPRVSRTVSAVSLLSMSRGLVPTNSNSLNRPRKESSHSTIMESSPDNC